MIRNRITHARLNASLSLLFNLLPGNALVHDLCVSYSNKGDELILEIPELNLTNNQFYAYKQHGRTEFAANGFAKALSDKERLVKARLYADEHTKIPLPFLEYRWGASVRFDTLAFELKGPKIEEDIQSLLGSAYVSGLPSTKSVYLWTRSYWIKALYTSRQTSVRTISN